MNTGTSSVATTTLDCLFPCGGLLTYGPGSRLIVPVYRPARNGRLLWIEQARLKDVKFALRIRDLSRQGASAGIDVPVVRQTSITGGPIVLLNIPTDSGFRHSLRIYDVNDHSRSMARVRIHPFPAAADTAPLADFVVTLEDDPLANTRPYRSVPAQKAINNLVDDLPSLRTTPAVTIQIDPVSDDARLWAFVSITNNATQEFTTVTPQ